MGKKRSVKRKKQNHKKIKKAERSKLFPSINKPVKVGKEKKSAPKQAKPKKEVPVVVPKSPETLTEKPSYKAYLDYDKLSLPTTYDENRITAVVRDLNYIFVYWDLSKAVTDRSAFITVNLYKSNIERFDYRTAMLHASYLKPAQPSSCYLEIDPAYSYYQARLIAESGRKIFLSLPSNIVKSERKNLLSGLKQITRFHDKLKESINRPVENLSESFPQFFKQESENRVLEPPHISNISAVHIPYIPSKRFQPQAEFAAKRQNAGELFKKFLASPNFLQRRLTPFNARPLYPAAKLQRSIPPSSNSFYRS